VVRLGLLAGVGNVAKFDYDTLLAEFEELDGSPCGTVEA